MTTTAAANPLDSFQWTPQPKAQALVDRLANRFLTQNAFARKLKARLYNEAAVRFSDLIDTIHVPTSLLRSGDFIEAGYVRRPIKGTSDRFVQEHGIFPEIIPHNSKGLTIDLKVESVVDFLAAWQSNARAHGSPRSALRGAKIAHGEHTDLWIVERHGLRGFGSLEIEPHTLAAVFAHEEAFRLRRRNFQSVTTGFANAAGMIDAAIADLGVARTSDLFFAAEREYWQRRNRAAQVQKARQDKLGIGWANHDHHTYRSSREHFAPMIARFEQMGFVCRERFYAGAQAGWGAQVLEQPEAGIIIFADVDLSPDELFTDFAHEGLAPRHELGTVGLWCALHGEAFFEAGMHHLECQFDFDALRQQLEGEEGVSVMKPFTDFPYLRQAFTQGEIWPVRPARIEKLLQEHRITAEQAEKFRTDGAIGSHLENLERNDGFKGFNQTGVSEIIARTDPRRQGAQHH